MNVLTSDIIENRKRLTRYVYNLDFISPVLKKQINLKTWRLSLFNNCGDSGFLLPNELRYPLKNPISNHYDCRIIYHSLVILNLNLDEEKYSTLYSTGKQIFNKINCSYSYSLGIEREENQMDLLRFLEMRNLILKGD